MSDEMVLMTVSVGNTHTTAVPWGADGNAGAVEKFASDFRSMQKVAERATKAKEVLLASVVKSCTSKLMNDLLALGKPLLIFRKDIPAPIRVGPQPAERVGDDRVAACMGAVTLDPASPWVVVDAGTAVTVNAVRPGSGDDPPRLEGGLIAPGAALCLRSLNQGTAQLPGIEAGAFEKSGFDFIGRNTEEAMLYGVLTLQAAAVSAMVEGQRAIVGSKAKVVFTGGGASFLVEAMRNTGALKFEPVLQPNLIHLGLHASWKAARK